MSYETEQYPQRVIDTHTQYLMESENKIDAMQATTAVMLDCNSLKIDEVSSSSCDLYLGDLPPNATESEIFTKFSNFGEVSEVIIKRAKATKESLGYGFVKFSSRDMARRAFTAFTCDEKGSDANRDYSSTRSGKFSLIRVCWAQKNCRIHVGNLSSSTTVAELNALFCHYGLVYEEATQVTTSGAFSDLLSH